MNCKQKCFYVVLGFIVLAIGFAVTNFLFSPATKEPEEDYILKRQADFSRHFPNCVRRTNCSLCISLYYAWPKRESDFVVWEKNIKSTKCEGAPPWGASTPDKYKRRRQFVITTDSYERYYTKTIMSKRKITYAAKGLDGTVFSTLEDTGDNYVFSVRGKEFKLDYPQAKELVHMLTLAEKSIIEFKPYELKE